jgi:hypothetical protein
MRLFLSLAVTFSVLVAAPAAGQGRGRASSDTVPKAQHPPPGMCRIWLPNVPAAKQAAPTDCATAVRNRPANARVIFGDSVTRPGRGRPVTPGTTANPANPSQLPIPTVAPTKTKTKTAPPPNPPPPPPSDGPAKRRNRG